MVRKSFFWSKTVNFFWDRLWDVQGAVYLLVLIFNTPH